MIAINNIEMPKRCVECKFCIRQKTNDYGSFGTCLLQNNKEVNCLVWSRDANCPLTEIPEIHKTEVRPKGKWINQHVIYNHTTKDFKVCSECRYEFSYDAETGKDEANYCPNCGAYMRGDNND